MVWGKGWSWYLFSVVLLDMRLSFYIGSICKSLEKRFGIKISVCEGFFMCGLYLKFLLRD